MPYKVGTRVRIKHFSELVPNENLARCSQRSIDRGDYYGITRETIDRAADLGVVTITAVSNALSSSDYEINGLDCFWAECMLKSAKINSR